MKTILTIIACAVAMTLLDLAHISHGTVALALVLVEILNDGMKGETP